MQCVGFYMVWLGWFQLTRVINSTTTTSTIDQDSKKDSKEITLFGLYDTININIMPRKKAKKFCRMV